MVITINLPDDLVTRLQNQADAKKIALDELITDLLTPASPLNIESTDDEDEPTLEEIVAQIKATPPNPAMIRRGTASLADLLADSPHDPDFDLETWEREWAKVEAEMKAVTRANDIAEGRR